MNKQMPCRKYTEIVWISSCKHCQLRFNTLIYAFYYEITSGAWNFSGQLPKWMCSTKDFLNDLGRSVLGLEREECPMKNWKKGLWENKHWHFFFFLPPLILILSVKLKSK